MRAGAVVRAVDGIGFGGGKMKDAKKMEKIYKAAELLEDFCSETACPECPIRKLCNKIDKNAPIADEIIKHIER